MYYRYYSKIKYKQLINKYKYINDTKININRLTLLTIKYNIIIPFINNRRFNK